MFAAGFVAWTFARRRQQHARVQEPWRNGGSSCDHPRCAGEQIQRGISLSARRARACVHALVRARVHAACEVVRMRRAGQRAGGSVGSCRDCRRRHTPQRASTMGEPKSCGRAPTATLSGPAATGACWQARRCARPSSLRVCSHAHHMRAHTTALHCMQYTGSLLPRLHAPTHAAGTTTHPPSPRPSRSRASRPRQHPKQRCRPPRLGSQRARWGAPRPGRHAPPLPTAVRRRRHRLLPSAAPTPS